MRKAVSHAFQLVVSPDLGLVFRHFGKAVPERGNFLGWKGSHPPVLALRQKNPAHDIYRCEHVYASDAPVSDWRCRHSFPIMNSIRYTLGPLTWREHAMIGRYQAKHKDCRTVHFRDTCNGGSWGEPFIRLNRLSSLEADTRCSGH